MLLTQDHLVSQFESPYDVTADDWYDHWNEEEEGIRENPHIPRSKMNC